MLNSEELKDLVEKVCKKIENEIDRENRSGSLINYLNTINCSELLGKHLPYSRDAKILVFGNSEISEDEMKRIAIENGISPKTLEFELDYKKNKHYDFSKLKNNTNYSDIIFGQLAHKGINIEGYSSAIAMMEHEPECYPNVIRSGGDLKISRNSFRLAIVKTQAYKDLLGY